MADQVEFVVESDGETNTVLADLAANLGVDAVASRRQNLDGSIPSWVFLASVSIPLLPELLRSLLSRRVRRIKVGDVEIDNPTAEHVQALLDHHLSQ